VSSLDRGRLDDPKQEACTILQEQLRPLEAAVEALSPGADQVVVLGDFNRNLWHEAHEVAGSEAVRSSGGADLTLPLAAGATSRNLFREVFDGTPGGLMTLVPLACASSPNDQALCDASKSRTLTQAETRTLASSKALGCSYPIGLDHFLVSVGLQPAIVSAEKVRIGPLGGSHQPQEGRPDPLLAVSDHCPIVLTLRF
jgi:exonuclease III